MPIPAGGSPAVPDWAPTLQEVADYTTARTLVPQVDGSNLEVFGFTSSTRPTDLQVNRLIADAVDWVLLRVGTLHADLYGAANGVACQRCAGFIELRYPERQSANRDDTITTAKELLKQADAALAALVARNETLTGTDPAQPVSVMPVWSFPTAPPDCYPL